MPAYHSSITAPRSVSNIALLPLRITTKCRGPAPTSQDPIDIIDETIGYFRFGFKLNSQKFEVNLSEQIFFFGIMKSNLILTEL